MNNPRSSPAQLARARRYYENNREKCKARAKQNRDRYNTIIVDARSVPCADCGNTFDNVCMDFHHVRGEKLFAVTHFRFVKKPVEMSKADQIRAEIAKCEVICANCHRLRHKGQGLMRRLPTR